MPATHVLPWDCRQRQPKLSAGSTAMPPLCDPLIAPCHQPTRRPRLHGLDAGAKLLWGAVSSRRRRDKLTTCGTGGEEIHPLAHGVIQPPARQLTLPHSQRAGRPPKAATITLQSSLSSPHPGLAASTGPRLWCHCRVVLPHLSSCGKTVVKTFQREDLPVKTQMSPISSSSVDSR